MEEYIIDDGKREIPVKNTLGEVLAVLRFRTTDINIVERAREAQLKIKESADKLTGIKLNADGTATDALDMKALNQVENEVKEHINYIFNDDVCSDLFRVCNPFSPVNGRFFLENVVDALVSIIEKEMSRQSEERIRKYTDDLL